VHTVYPQKPPITHVTWQWLYLWNKGLCNISCVLCGNSYFCIVL